MKKIIVKNVANELNQKFLIRAKNEDILDVNFKIFHQKPNTNSRIEICILASDNSKVNVDATLIIEKSAPNTNAWLEIRVIARENANVVASPNLEIRNNSVKAGHSLTTKYISDEELFYIMSRGISREKAGKLITESFVKPFLKGEIIEIKKSKLNSMKSEK